MPVVCLPKLECPCGADRGGWRRTFVLNSILVRPVGPPPHGVWRTPLRVAAVWTVGVPATPKVQTRKASAFLRRRTCPGHQFPSCTTREWPVCPDGRYTRRSACRVYRLWGSVEDCRQQGFLQEQGHAGQAHHGKYGEDQPWLSPSLSAFSMNALMSSARQTVVRGPSFSGFG